LFKASVDVGLRDIPTIIKKHAKQISDYISEYADAIDPSAQEQSARDYARATKHIVKEVFNITEDQFRAAGLDRIILEWAAENADAFEKAGGITEKALIDLGQRIYNALDGSVKICVYFYLKCLNGLPSQFSFTN